MFLRSSLSLSLNNVRKFFFRGKTFLFAGNVTYDASTVTEVAFF